MRSTFVALVLGVFVGLGVQLALAQPVDANLAKVRNLTITNSASVGNDLTVGDDLAVTGDLTATLLDAGNARVNGALTAIGTAKLETVDAGVLNVVGQATFQSSVTVPGTTGNNIYGIFMCDTLNARVGANCIGAGSSALELYSGPGNKQWIIDTSGHLVPSGATQKAQATNNATTCTLDGASPSVCTATVTASAKCVCSNVGATAAIAANGCAVGLSGTTLTVTSANGATNVVNIWCDR
jgi:hypothetical protein